MINAKNYLKISRFARISCAVCQNRRSVKMASGDWESVKTEACHPLSFRTLLTPMLPTAKKQEKNIGAMWQILKKTSIQTASFSKTALSERKHLMKKPSLWPMVPISERITRGMLKKRIPPLLRQRSVDVMSQIYMPILSWMKSTQGSRNAQQAYHPKSCSLNSKGHFYVSFPICCCKNCPNKDKCKPKFHKQVASLFVSSDGVHRAQAKRFKGTETFKLLARIRNGVETIPSVLRSKYNADRMPVCGCIPGRLFFGFKIAALNFGKLMTYRKKRGNYAQNPILIGN